MILTNNRDEQIMEEQSENINRNYYEVRDLYKFGEEVIDFATCQNNKKFIVFLKQSQMMKIKRTNYLKHYKQIKFKFKSKFEAQNVQVAFSNNKQFIFLIYNIESQVAILRNDKQCKLINTFKISDKIIKCHKQIENEQLLTGHIGGRIILTDIRKRKQLLQISTFQTYIDQIEFDQKNKVIISLRIDKSIKFFAINGQKLLETHKSGLSIFLTSDNHILSASNNKIKLWSIDYANKQLILLQQIKDLANLNHIQYDMDKSKLIFFEQKRIKIFYKNLELEQEQLLKIENLGHNCFTNQSSAIKLQNKFTIFFCYEEVRKHMLLILKKQF